MRIRKAIGIAAVLVLVPTGAASADGGTGGNGSSEAGAKLVRFADKDCADFDSRRQAQRFFRRHNPRRDPHNLDADNDGKACEDSFKRS